jgi:hypothetical protein
MGGDSGWSLSPAASLAEGLAAADSVTALSFFSFFGACFFSPAPTVGALLGSAADAAFPAGAGSAFPETELFCVEGATPSVDSSDAIIESSRESDFDMAMTTCAPVIQKLFTFQDEANDEEHPGREDTTGKITERESVGKQVPRIVSGARPQLYCTVFRAVGMRVLSVEPSLQSRARSGRE